MRRDRCAPIWRTNLVNRLDPDGTTRDYIDRRIAQAFGYPERRPGDDVEPPPMQGKADRDG